MMVVERNSARIIERLLREGWEVRSTSGSHVKLKRAGEQWHIVVPHPKKDLPTGLAIKIAKLAGWN